MIPKLQEKAYKTGSQMDIQAVADMEQFVTVLINEFVIYNYHVKLPSKPHLKFG